MHDLSLLTDLQNQAEAFKSLSMRDLFAKEPNRFEHYHIKTDALLLDYSKNLINDDVIKLLIKLADSCKLVDKIDQLFRGDPLNNTEHRAALHTALRRQGNEPIEVNGHTILNDIQQTLIKMQTFERHVRHGDYRSSTDKAFTDIVNIGIGGSDLGPKMVTRALTPYHQGHLRVHFVSNIDASDLVETLKPLNPETTLFIIASKTFTTLETLQNAQSAKQWLFENLSANNNIAKHFIGITTNDKNAIAFGIDHENIFPIWDWVGGRYSLWSAMGLPIVFAIGFEHFKALLLGAFEMDQHFKTSNFEQNLPVMLALLGIWSIQFFKYQTLAVLPYDHLLSLFPAYLQQLDMESNGKSIQKDGQTIDYHTGPVVWGQAGTNGQHAFHQLLLQGTQTVPIDFLIAVNSHYPLNHHHESLFASCLSQSQALMIGKTEDEAKQELLKAGLTEQDASFLAKHQMVPGNRPSNTFIYEKLTPHVLGQLIALYEHKVFTQGVIWNINSFDQWGVELGKQITKKMIPTLKNKDLNNEFDSSTNGLIDYFHKVKQNEQ